MSILNLNIPEISQKCENGVNYITFKRPDHFDIYKIFECGQTFCFLPDEDGISGVVGGRFIKFVQSENDVKVYGCNSEDYYTFLADYLSLDVDYKQVDADIFSNFPKDGVINSCAEVSNGIRILNQPFWETLCAFIISQNNNIPRIRKLIFAISEQCGDKISCFDGKDRYAFPSAEQLLSCKEDGLRALKTGFRAGYLISAAEHCKAGFFDDILSLPYAEAKNKLLSVKGVGEKVANCVLLFSCRQYQAFPVDVWIKRVIDKYYGGNLNTDFLGKYAGIAQQYLFYNERYIISQKEREKS